MCVLFLHYCLGAGDCSCPYLLIAANNRDESFVRPTAPAHYWTDHPHVLAGRDLSVGGTWMGISTRGKFAVLTNYRTPKSEIDSTARSRGRLVSDYLCGDMSALDYCTKLNDGHKYNGFALITADICAGGSLVYTSNRELGGCQKVEPGTHGLSNHLLNSPWKKVERGRGILAEIVANVSQAPVSREILTEQLLELLSDDTCLYPDPEIPDTGMTDELMRLVSAIFVKPSGQGEQAYGTRTSSVVLVGKDGHVTFTERTRTEPANTSSHHWTKSTFNFEVKI